MSDKSKIEWTDATWNPITGCTLVSEGCRNCYAAELAAGRLASHPSRVGLARRNADGTAKFTGEARFNKDWLDQPLRWKAPRMIFVCAHGDLFHESVPDEWIDQVFAVMSVARRHTFQVLTKRPERMRDYLNENARIWKWFGVNKEADPEYCENARFEDGELPYTWPLPNVWLGVSVENQDTANARVPVLLETPAALRFLSCEPLLGPVDLEMMDYGEGDIKPLSPWTWRDLWEGGYRGTGNSIAEDQAHFCDWYGLSEMPDLSAKPLPGIDWVIVGGESGRDARPMHPDWARSVRDQCAEAGVPFLFKQWGEWNTRGHAFSKGLIDDPYCGPENPKVEAPWGWESVIMYRAGKAQAGRALDGRIYDAMPTQGGAEC